MSVISHLILQIPLLEEHRYEDVKKIFKDMDFEPPTNMNLRDKDGNYMYAGSKVWCLNTYYGCYNHFPPVEDLLDELRKLQWNNPMEVKVFFETENQDSHEGLREYTLYKHEKLLQFLNEVDPEQKGWGIAELEYKGIPIINDDRIDEK